MGPFRSRALHRSLRWQTAATAGTVAPVRGESAAVNCRPGCGACCIAISISSPIPGMPRGKPAGVPCVQLRDDMECAIFGRPERPACCSGLRPSDEMCGGDRSHAMTWLARLEQATLPAAENTPHRPP
ncbi:YkgJ family cysteine cluster protein [Methylococcus capsulatus]|uniref:YkgJ family cysteine cluster protein n=1 Tax=Methylococcus capsulatus TaxID=414 RepID=UPI003082ECD8